jgi:hypothetical protein
VPAHLELREVHPARPAEEGERLQLEAGTGPEGRGDALVLAEAGLVALATVLAWVYARRALGAGAAYALALAFGLAWPLQEAAVVGFHETLFAVPLLMLAFERLQAGHRGQAALAALALCTVKEDLCVVAAGFGVLLWLRGGRRLGLAVAVAGMSDVRSPVSETGVPPASAVVADEAG